MSIAGLEKIQGHWLGIQVVLCDIWRWVAICVNGPQQCFAGEATVCVPSARAGSLPFDLSGKIEGESARRHRLRLKDAA